MLTHYCELCIHVGEQEGIERFFVTNLGEDQAILGYPWIEHFDPPFDWKNKKLKGDIIAVFKRVDYCGNSQKNVHQNDLIYLS
jgi:hypothetical protein